MLRIRLSLFAAAFAASLISGCSGGGGGITQPPPPTCPPNCPPPVESIATNIVSPTVGTTFTITTTSVSVTISATAISSTEGNITGTATFLWTVDGVSVSGSSANLTMNFSVGSHPVCTTAKSQTGVVGNQACFTLVVTQLPSINIHAYVANLDGSTHTFSGEYAVVMDKFMQAPLDSVLLDANGNAKYSNSAYTSLDSASIILRGDPTLEWTAQQYPKAYYANLNILVSPRSSVTIPSGEYKGTVFPINIGAPYVVVSSTGANHTSFYIRTQLANGSYLYSVGDWKTLPMPVVLNGAKSAQDTSKVLSALSSIEAKFGFKMFALTDAVTASKGCGITLNLNQSNVSDGTLEIAQDFCNGVVNIGVPDSLWSLFGVSIIQAETMHVLGAGHTCEWLSTIASSCSYSAPMTIQSGDVAYTLLLWRFRDMERKYNTPFSLGGNYEGWRLRNGQSYEPIAIP